MNRWAACSGPCADRNTLRQDNAALVELHQAERARLAQDETAKRADWRACCVPRRWFGPAAPLKALLAQDRVAGGARPGLQGYLQRGQVERLRVLSAELQRLDAVQREIAERRVIARRGDAGGAAQLASLQRAREERAACSPASTSQPTRIAQTARGTQPRCEGLAGVCWRNCVPQRPVAARDARTPRRAPMRPARRADAERSAGRPWPVTPPLRVGGLGWPVAGNLLASFGGRLPDGRRPGDGVLIAAPAGTAIRPSPRHRGVRGLDDRLRQHPDRRPTATLSLYAHAADGLLRIRARRSGMATRWRRSAPRAGRRWRRSTSRLRRNVAPVNPAGWLTRQ